MIIGVLLFYRLFRSIPCGLLAFLLDQNVLFITLIFCYFIKLFTMLILV